ncbi:hypothetical protein BDZ94DRAFT_1248435 [Collybia nuda]|uniref:Uncharacterized protein n=1 Tax=Collybia nuda TaxID=64659 RepID=A0A9P5YCP5_9AGAR|nr:hypothetical protein BDZ94DRAFT_1248435 [Collybia nuda]
MKLSTFYPFLVGTVISGVVAQLSDQLVTDLNNYLDVTTDLEFNFVHLPVDFDTQSQVSAITNGLDRLTRAINAFNTTATDLAANSPTLAPADAAQIIDTIQIIAGNTTGMVSALVTKTYFCQNFGIFIDAAMVPAKETIFLALNSIGKITPDPLDTLLVSSRTSLTNSYFKVLVYRNLFHDFDSPCIPWGTA